MLWQRQGRIYRRAEGAPAPYCPKFHGAPHSPLKILETIDEEKEEARKKKSHQPPAFHSWFRH